MCRRAVCQSCGKVTYEGCGRHVEQVLAGVPSPQRCRCEPAERKPVRTGEPMTRTAPELDRSDGTVRSANVSRGVDGSPDRSQGGWWTRLIAWMKSPA